MNEQDFAVAIFALFFTGYVLIRLIFAVPRKQHQCSDEVNIGRTKRAVDLAYAGEDADIDTTYHYDEDGQYMPDWAAYDEQEVTARKREISCGACTVAIGAHSYDARCAKG